MKFSEAMKHLEDGKNVLGDGLLYRSTYGKCGQRILQVYKNGWETNRDSYDILINTKWEIYIEPKEPKEPTKVLMRFYINNEMYCGEWWLDTEPVGSHFVKTNWTKEVEISK